MLLSTEKVVVVRSLLSFFLILGFLHSKAQAEVLSPVILSKARHDVQFLDGGGGALERVLSMIERAQESVEISNYNFGFCYDLSAQLLFEAIFKRAEQARLQGRPFHARVIMEDFTTSFYSESEFWPWRRFVKEFKEKGLEFRIFNPRDVAYDGDVWYGNARSHQKLLIVDGKEMVLGGRNFTDDYFGFVKHFNRIDKDIWVRGPIVSDARSRFLTLWDHPVTKNFLKNPDSVEYDRDLVNSVQSHKIRRATSKHVDQIRSCLSEGVAGVLARHKKWREEDPNTQVIDMKKLLSGLKDEGRKRDQRTPVVAVNEIGLGFDLPKVRSSYKATNFVSFFYESIGRAKQEVIFENQYFIPNDATRKLLDGLGEKGVEVSFLTNSIMSQDEDGPGTLTHSRIREYQAQNAGFFKGYAFSGHNPTSPGAQWWAPAKDAVWQIHSKTVVIDRRHTWIGSNNFDNRSDEFNLEIAVLVPNSEVFATQVRKAIVANIENSYSFGPDSSYWQTYEQKRQSKPFVRRAIGFLLEPIQSAIDFMW